MTPQPGAAAEADHVAAEEVLFEGHPAVIPGLGSLLVVVLSLGLALIYYYLRSRSRHLRITTERIVVDHGLFSKRMEQIDLYRITDYVVERPFSQRLLGTGNIQLRAMDSTTPSLGLDALPTDVRALYERLRAATEIEKRRRGVRVVDYD
ncbi:MAG: PH domain-containing protein [Polyangiaceae bacterium]|nr:PH domain-containing protein [Polyangiaceae bacterium]